MESPSISTSTTAKTNRRPNKLEFDDQEVLNYLKQVGVNPVTQQSVISTTYGKSNEALLAALLKDQGIGPPKSRNTDALLQQLQLAVSIWNGRDLKDPISGNLICFCFRLFWIKLS